MSPWGVLPSTPQACPGRSTRARRADRTVGNTRIARSTLAAWVAPVFRTDTQNLAAQSRTQIQAAASAGRRPQVLACSIGPWTLRSRGSRRSGTTWARRLQLPCSRQRTPVGALRECCSSSASRASVAHALNKSLGLKLRVPETAMVTCFDGDGSHFVAHRDNACVVPDDAGASPPSAGTGCINSREVTAILYANVDWDETNGGALRCHIGADDDDGTGETATGVRDVAPHAGRLVLFKSRELLHEVLPSYGRRLAISLWLLDVGLALRDGST